MSAAPGRLNNGTDVNPMPPPESILEANIRLHEQKGVGRWRQLYLTFLAELEPGSVVEFGSGDPRFLGALPPAVRTLGVDGNPNLAARHETAGVPFLLLDFDHDSLPPSLRGAFEVAICSDVLEHLVYPAKLLDTISSALKPSGILFSHVPNEFQLGHLLPILLGRSDGVQYQFRGRCGEWNYPHVRRFTDLGYRRFLERRFRHNLKLTDLEHGRIARVLRSLRLPVPYTLELGPTYVSTNDPDRFRALVEIKGRSEA